MHAPAAIAEDEASLLRKARWGDRQAFEALYRLHAGAVHTLAWRLTGTRAAAEDITQDTFLKMLQFLGGLRSDTPLRPWLKKVAANAAIDRLRRERRYSAVEDDAQWAEAAPGPAQGTQTAQLLQRLPAAARTVVWLHEMEGWTHDEIAQRFGQRPSWSKSVMSRALARLRRELHEDEARGLPHELA